MTVHLAVTDMVATGPSLATKIRILVEWQMCNLNAARIWVAIIFYVPAGNLFLRSLISPYRAPRARDRFADIPL